MLDGYSNSFHSAITMIQMINFFEGCSSPMFGRDCSRQCHCLVGDCDVITGECDSPGCKTGYQGIDCSIGEFCMRPFLATLTPLYNFM